MNMNALINKEGDITLLNLDQSCWVFVYDDKAILGFPNNEEIILEQKDFEQSLKEFFTPQASRSGENFYEGELTG